jgi:hypothetical protein
MSTPQPSNPSAEPPSGPGVRPDGGVKLLLKALRALLLLSAATGVADRLGLWPF